MMPNLIRLWAAFVVCVATTYFTFWVPMAFIEFPRTSKLPGFISLGAGLAAGVLVWRHFSLASESLLTEILTWGGLVGSIGFCLGFFGPMILFPSEGEGPLLGLLVTGPLSFLTGCVIGAVRWMLRRARTTR